MRTGGKLNWIGENRRKYPRIVTILPVQYKKIGQGKMPFFNMKDKLKSTAQTLNICRTGICLRVHNEIKRGSVLGLTVKYAHDDQDFYSMGRVIWCRRTEEEKRYGVGIEFDVIGKKENWKTK